MILLACGGRDYTDRDAVFRALDRAHAKRPVAMLIHGAARGADTLAGEWADERGILSAAVKALWDKHGRQEAGPIRNRGMLELRPDAVVGFPGGAGTRDMLTAAREAGVTVWEPYKQSPAVPAKE